MKAKKRKPKPKHRPKPKPNRGSNGAVMHSMITVRFADADWDELSAMSKAAGLTIAQLVRLVTRLALQRYKRERTP